MINTGYAHYRHRTPPTAESWTVTLSNHHCPTKIPTGSTQENTRLKPRGYYRYNWNNHAAMVKYTIATLQAMVGAKPTGTIHKIHERLKFCTLWNLQGNIFYVLLKSVNIKFLIDVHSG